MIIEEKPGSPFIHLSVKECLFEITGNSYSEYVNEIYEKVIKWVEDEMPEIDCNIDCKFNFNVSNSVTYKNILSIMTKFAELQNNGKKITVIWYYQKDDEDSLAIGEDIETLFNLPVRFIESN